MSACCVQNLNLPETTTDVERRNRLVMEHLFLVARIVMKMRIKLPDRVDPNDLLQEGALGLIDAAAKYKIGENVAFPVYASYRIRGAILDSLRHLDHASRIMRARQRQIVAATGQLTSALGSLPSEEAVAERLGVSVEWLRKTMLSLRRLSLVSISDGELLSNHPFPHEDGCHPDFNIGRMQLRGALGDAIASLPEASRKVLILHDYFGWPMSAIGRRLGIGESRVSQIRTSALKKMRKGLRARGIGSSHSFVA